MAYQDRTGADTAVADRKAPNSSTTVLVSRRESFNAAHQLRDPGKSDEENERLFGKCANLHGHNYVLEVIVAGEVEPDTGYVMDLGELKRLLQRAILDKCDHRNLNDEVDFLRGINPSTENLVIAFWNEIEPHIMAGKLHRVRLYETPRNFAEYLGPDST